MKSYAIPTQARGENMVILCSSVINTSNVMHQAIDQTRRVLRIFDNTVPSINESRTKLLTPHRSLHIILTATSANYFTTFEHHDARITRCARIVRARVQARR